MFDPTKVAALKTLGFSDDDIAGLQSQAEQTEKAATEQGVAYKADEPLPDVIINGVTYKAFPPKALADTGVESPVVEEDKADPMADMAEPMEEPSEGGLTLSPEDLSAIGDAIAQALQGAVSQIMGGLDLEKKVAGHVAGLMAPYQTTKDAETAQTREQLAQLQQQVNELTGDQPAKPYRASESKNTALTDATMLAAAKQLSDPNAADPWADIRNGLFPSRPQ